MFYLVSATTSYQDSDLEFWNLYLFNTKPEAQDYITRLQVLSQDHWYNSHRQGYVFNSAAWDKLDPDRKISSLQFGPPDPSHPIIAGGVNYSIEEMSIINPQSAV